MGNISGARLFSLLTGAVRREFHFRTASVDTLVASHRFFSIPRRSEFTLPRDETPVYCVFGASGVVFDKIGGYFRGVPLIFVRMTRRGAFTKETLRIVARIGPSVRPVFATLDAFQQVSKDAPHLAAAGYIAIGSPLVLVSAAKGIDALWLKPVSEKDRTEHGRANAAALAQLFASITENAGEFPAVRAVVLSSFIGFQVQKGELDVVEKLSREPRGAMQPGDLCCVVSPFALDSASRKVSGGEALAIAAVLKAPRTQSDIVCCDETTAAALTLAGFTVRLQALGGRFGEGSVAEIPERMGHERAVSILARSLSESRYVASRSRRPLSLADVEARLGLRALHLVPRSSIVSALVDLGLIDANQAGILAREILEAGVLGPVGAHILRGVILQEASIDPPLLLRRIDLVDDILDFAMSSLAAVDQPAVIKLRLKIDGNVGVAIDDIRALLKVQGATSDLLAAIAESFAAYPQITLSLARHFAGAGANRIALALIHPTAQRSDASTEVLHFTIEMQLDLGLTTAAVVTGERLAALDPTDPTVIEAIQDASAAGAASAHIANLSDDSAHGVFRQARFALRAGDSAAAEKFLRRAIVMNSDHLSNAAAEDLTNILLSQNRGDEALAVVAESVSKTVGRMRANASVVLSEMQFLAGFNDAALDTLRAAEAAGSTVAGTRLRALLVRNGRLNEEIADYSKIYARSPSLNRLSHLMHMLAMADRIPEMRAMAEQARQDRVGNPVDVAYLEGVTLVRHMLWPDVLDLLTPYFDSSPRGARIAMLVGRASQGVGDTGRALVAFRAAAQNASTLNGAQIELARLAEGMGDLPEAARLYTELLATNPISQHYGARWASVVRRTASISHVYNSLAAQAQHSLDSREAFWLSLLSAEMGRIDKLISWARRATELEPLNVGLVRHLIEALIIDADYEAARAVVNNFASRVRRTGARTIEVAEMYRIIGAMDESLGFAEMAVTLAPRNPSVLQVAARIHYENESFAEARRLIRTSLEIDPARMGSYTLGARIARRIDHMEEAQQLNDAAARIWPDRAVAISPKVEQAIIERDSASADRNVHRVIERARLHGERQPLRLLWGVAALYAEKRDIARFKDLAREVLNAIHAVFPPDTTLWKGESLSKESVMVLARGGPGDELRLFSSVLRGLHREAGRLVHVGDKRLESIFKRNFPGAEFVANPWAGRRLGRKRAQITDEMRRSFLPGTLEATRRFGVYLPRRTVETVRYVAVADSLVTTRLYPHFGDTAPVGDRRPLLPDEKMLAEAGAFLDGLPPGPKVGISWRASYLSANRFSGGFFNVEEMHEILSVKGVIFIDLHPNVFEDEFARAVELAGGRFVRPPFDLYNDFEAIAALCVKLDAVIVPGVTQRDVAGAFRQADVWSFNLAPEYSERWRVGLGDRDQFQPHIIHHDTMGHHDRAGIARALKTRVETLARG